MSCEAPRSVASGAVSWSPTNGSLQRRAEARHLVQGRLDDVLLAACAGEVVLGRVEQVVPDPRVDERAAARPCAASPSRSASPATRRSASPSCRGSRTGPSGLRAARRRRFPPTASISSAEAVEVDEHDVVHVGSPVRSLTARRASAGPPIWLAALIFATPVPRESRPGGPAGWRGTRAAVLPGSVRSSMIESDRLALVPAGAVAAVSPEDEDRRRCRDRAGRRCFASCRSTPAGTRSFAALTPLATDEVAPHGPRDKTGRPAAREPTRDPATRTARFRAAISVRSQGRASPACAGRTCASSAEPAPWPCRPDRPGTACPERASGRVW